MGSIVSIPRFALDSSPASQATRPPIVDEDHRSLPRTIARKS